MPHTYTSAKSDFLQWDMWVHQNGTDEEKLIHAQEPDSPEKLALYNKWIAAEQINSHKFVDDNGVETIFFDNRS